MKAGLALLVLSAVWGFVRNFDRDRKRKMRSRLEDPFIRKKMEERLDPPTFFLQSRTAVAGCAITVS